MTLIQEVSVSWEKTMKIDYRVNKINNIVSILLLTGLFAASTLAQVKSTTQGQTSAALAPGRPAGSYGVSEIESINLFGGRVNASVPLLQLGGRGGAGIDHERRVDEPSQGLRRRRSLLFHQLQAR